MSQTTAKRPTRSRPSNASTRFGRSSRPGGSYRSGGRPQTKSRQPKKDYIHPSKFIQSARPVTEEPYVPQHHFSDFAVDPLILNNLTHMGYSTPSPIQDETIPHSLSGKDIVGIANTGTGKTAAFAIPVLHRLMHQPKGKAIIIAPTRELAEQIEQQCRLIGKGSGLYGALLIGGTPMNPQLRDLQHNPRIIIGTPGRIKDHLNRGSLDLSDGSIVVLDEVDRMLDMGFVHDITHILGHIKGSKQSFYFSATLDARVRGIINNFANDPVFVSVKSQETSANVEQDIVTYAETSEKIDKLQDILNTEKAAKTIIFDDTQRAVERLSKELIKRGFAAASIHGGKSQSQRQRVLKKFKDNTATVLVATDVAARGLDISDITHVINYSLPQTYADYTHRIGRTGRAGKTGHALTFVEG